MEGYKFRVCGNGGQHYYSIINDKYLTRFSVPLHPKPQAEQINPAYKTKRLKVMALNKKDWDSVVAERKRRSKIGLKKTKKLKRSTTQPH